MIVRFLAFLAACVAVVTMAYAGPQMPSRTLAEAPTQPEFFRASHLPARKAVALSAPAQKGAALLDERGRLRIGSVRPLPKAAAVDDWAAIPEGLVSRLIASSDEAQGLRVRLDVGRLEAPIEVRAQGVDGRVEFMRVEPSQAPEVWTPWTPGSSQLIEIFSAGAPPEGAITIGAIVHFDESPFAKAAAGSCTVPASCTTNDNVLDAAIAERTKSTVKILFTEGGSAYVCSATLINTDRFPAGYLLTANHCVSTTAVANTVTTFWFYNSNSCTDLAVNPTYVQKSGGTQLVFTNYNPDSTLLLMPTSPPAGAVYSGWNADHVLAHEAVVSISYPKGDTSRIALGTMEHEYRISDRAQDEYGVTFSRGIIEGGSSGSGMFTLAGSTLQLRGILTGTTIRNDPHGMSCTNTDEDALYGRFEIFYPQMAQYLRASGPIADDTPNRVIDYATVPAEAVLNGRTVTYDRLIDYVGDVDVFRFTLSASADVTLSTQGTMDTIGTLMDAQGDFIEANDDVAVGNLNFGITRTLDAGTYYVMVAPWEPDVVGPYRLVMTAATAAPATTNFTDLWWNPSESGWGINLDHQGNIVFATLYTYDVDGTAMWLYMSNGDKQADGSFLGMLYRATGPVFNASPWSAVTSTPIGTMRLTFTSPQAGNLTYSVNGLNVTKSITRYAFSTPTTCTWSESDRATATNYQDLWWNPSESGWGVNLAHQGNILFATLYTYDANRKALWFSMSEGRLVGARTYSGTLYRSTGPAFNASPWSAIALTSVGTMTFAFTDGKSGTMTYSVNGVQVVKQISRFEFSNPKPLCSSS